MNSAIEGNLIEGHGKLIPRLVVEDDRHVAVVHQRRVKPQSTSPVSQVWGTWDFQDLSSLGQGQEGIRVAPRGVCRDGHESTEGGLFVAKSQTKCELLKTQIQPVRF